MGVCSRITLFGKLMPLGNPKKKKIQFNSYKGYLWKTRVKVIKFQGFYYLFIFSEIVDMPSSLPLQHYLKHWQKFFGVSWSYRVEFVLSKYWGISWKEKCLLENGCIVHTIYFSHSAHYTNLTFHEIICKDVKNIPWY